MADTEPAAQAATAPTTENTPAESTPAAPAAAPPTPNPASPDPDAQAELVTALRTQITDLITQVTQLNSKLVSSYDRVSDLEDSLHAHSQQVRSSSTRISQLELERAQHLDALNTGLLVNRSDVTLELTRLMEKATEEASQRGEAETAKLNIEKDLDDLSASLFHQANTMVAEARLARAEADRKREDSETALKGAEEAVGVMQQQMQEMMRERERAMKEVGEMRVRMARGKFKAPSSPEEVNKAGLGALTRKLRCMVPPYHEFLLFIAHLRSIRPVHASPPATSALLQQPFLARIHTEDS